MSFTHTAWIAINGYRTPSVVTLDWNCWILRDGKSLTSKLFPFFRQTSSRPVFDEPLYRNQPAEKKCFEPDAVISSPLELSCECCDMRCLRYAARTPQFTLFPLEWWSTSNILFRTVHARRFRQSVIGKSCVKRVKVMGRGLLLSSSRPTVGQAQ